MTLSHAVPSLSRLIIRTSSAMTPITRISSSRAASSATNIIIVIIRVTPVRVAEGNNVVCGADGVVNKESGVVCGADGVVNKESGVVC